MWGGLGSTGSGLRLVRGSCGVGGGQPRVVYDWSGVIRGRWGSTGSGLRLVPGSCGMGGGQPEVV